VPYGTILSLRQSDDSTIQSLESSVYAVAKTIHDYIGTDSSHQEATLSNIVGYATDADTCFFQYHYDGESHLSLRHQAVASSNSKTSDGGVPLVLLTGHGVKISMNDSSYTNTYNTAVSSIDANVSIQNSRMTSASPYGTLILKGGTHNISTSILQNVSQSTSSASAVQLLSNAVVIFSASELDTKIGSTIDGDSTGTVQLGTSNLSTQNEYVIQRIDKLIQSGSNLFSNNKIPASITTVLKENTANHFE
jgi:hypothetical protein